MPAQRVVETNRAVRGCAGSVEPLDKVTQAINYLCLLVDLEPAAGVPETGSCFHAVIWRCFKWQKSMFPPEFRVLASRAVLVEALQCAGQLCRVNAE